MDTARLGICGFLVLLAGCAATQERPEVETVPPEHPLLISARAAAKPCSVDGRNPAPAIHKVDSKSRYGCFCGKNYPGHTLNGRTGASLTENERYELIAEYLKVTPFDEIDAACQAHDICWTWHGRSEQACNDAFESRLEELRSKWKAKGAAHESPEERCAYLALVFSFTSTAFFENRSDEWTEERGQRLGRVVALPFIVGGFLAWLVGSLFNSYPAPDVTCTFS